jgi:hypothetical protein
MAIQNQLENLKKLRKTIKIVKQVTSSRLGVLVLGKKYSNGLALTNLCAETKSRNRNKR